MLAELHVFRQPPNVEDTGERMSSNRKLIIVASIAIVLAGLACTSVPLAFAQSSGATIVGQVTVNGNATNGVLVTCGPGSNTTFDYNGAPGYYVISGLPYNTTMPFKAEYQGQSYTDTVDPLPSGQPYSNIPAVNINVPVSTPTAVPNVTATPAPNATATPEPNATATPARMRLSRLRRQLMRQSQPRLLR